MSAHVLMNLSCGKDIKYMSCRVLYCFFATNLINSIIYRSTNGRFCLSLDIKITLKLYFGVILPLCTQHCYRHQYIISTNGSALLNKMAARAQDMKHLG